MDLLCQQCLEPWDQYGVYHGDLGPGERDKFLKGKGCPCCQWGTACPSCSGTGIDRIPSCNCSNGQILIRCLTTTNPGYYHLKCSEWTTGYKPNERVVEPKLGGDIRVINSGECLEGTYREGWMPCDQCKGKDEDGIILCSTCAGTGELQPDERTEKVQALAELLGDDTDGLAAMIEDMGL